MRWFLPLMAAGGVAMSLTAPLEVVFAREFWHTGLFIGIFMLSASLGVIVVDVFGTRLLPGLDAKVTLIVGLVFFGVATIGIGLATGSVLLMASRVLQGVGGGMVLGAGLQAAVRVRPIADDVAQSVGRFNAAFLFGGAIGSPGGLLVAGFIEGRLGYQAAFVGTGVLALVVAAALTVALPRLVAPPGVAPARIGLPRFDRTPGSRAALVLAMSGDFLRGGVLFTALPLAGAALEYSTMTISLAIALMSGVEILVLLLAYRYVRSDGVVPILIASFALGMVCAALLALVPGVTTYLAASALFGVSLAGATVSLPVLVVAQVGESAAGLAKFRISAGIGLLAGSVGCAVLGAQLGIAALFGLIAVVLLASTQLARVVGRRMAPT
jgi:predicted MFS family arabinose efflux permease